MGGRAGGVIDTEARPSRWQERERHPQRLTRSTVPCRAHQGRFTPAGTTHKPTSHRYHGSKTSHVHLPRRDCPVTFGDDQKWRACSCGQLKTGCTDAELAAWWDRHRRGQPDAELPEETKPRKVLRSWRGKLTSLRTAAAQVTVMIRTTLADSSTVQKPSVSGIRCRIASASSSVRFALDALRCLRPHGHDEVANSINQFGDPCLDPAKGFALRHNVRTVSFTDRAGAQIDLIRTRRDGRAGWVAVTKAGDTFDGRFFPTVSGGAGVDLWFRSVGTTYASTTSWSTTASSGGSAGVVPAATDRAIFDSGSASCSIGAAAVCRSLDCAAGTTYAGTMSGSFSLTIGDATAPTGNVQLRVRGTWSHLGNVTFTNTGGTSNTVDANNQSLGGFGTTAWSFATGTLTLSDHVTMVISNKTGAGTLNTNGKSFTTSGTMSFTSGSLGCSSSVFTCGGSALTVTPTTLSAQTSEFIMNNTSGGTTTFNGTGKIFYKVTSSLAGGKTDVLSIAGDFSVTLGGLTLNGGSVTGRTLVQSTTLGTARTITLSLTGVTASNVDFMDIAMTGATVNLAAITGLSGDCGGNSGITFTTSAAQTATGTASFTWSTHGWTSRVPLPQDDVSIPNAFVVGRTVTNDMPRMGRSITFSCTGNPGLVLAGGSVYGSLDLTGIASGNSNQGVTFAGRGSYTLTNHGTVFTQDSTLNAPGGTYTIQDTFASSRPSFTALNILAGTWTDNGQTHTFTNNAGATLNGASATANITGTWNFTTTTTFWTYTAGTVNASSSTFVLAGASTSTRTFAGGGKTYGTLTYTVANSPGILSVTGNNSWAGTWNIGPGRIVQCPSGGTQTFTAANGLGGVAGSNNGYWRTNKSGYVSAPDIAAYTGSGTMRMIVRAALDNYADGTNQVLLSHYTQATNQEGWELLVSNTGTYGVRISSDGITNTINRLASMTGGNAWVNGTTYWMGAEYVTSTGALNIYRAADIGNNTPPSLWGGWTLIDTSTQTAFTPFDSSAAIEVSGRDAGGNETCNGNFYYARFDSGGATQFDCNFTTKAFGANTFTETSANLALVTINGALAQAGDGRVVLQAASTTTTLATGSGSTMTYTVPDHILATPAGAVYVLDGVDGGSNTGIVFMPPDSKAPSGPGDVDTARGPALVATTSRIRASRY